MPGGDDAPVLTEKRPPVSNDGGEENSTPWPSSGQSSRDTSLPEPVPSSGLKTINARPGSKKSIFPSSPNDRGVFRQGSARLRVSPCHQIRVSDQGHTPQMWGKGARMRQILRRAMKDVE
ncbi:hypothetical protein RRG08_042781 [Elysia crispata]|uniref:Uncharacterized protein n=1 Tax=Elysia crispata TaxID=231223 RepID=A0AAE0XR45_9GAST|nr:hypothetical protein RRG08_042781 [Elysia crispata]